MLTQVILAFQIASCTNCQIQAKRVVRISDLDGRAGLSYPTGITRSASGNWLVTHAGAPGQLAEFAPDGSFLRSIGRHGSGPGEFRTATLVNVGPADSVWVMDATLGRATVLSPSLQYVRSYKVNVPYIANMRPVSDGRFVIDAQILTDNRAGYPLHVLERDGSISKSFAVENPVYRQDKSELSRRVFWPAGPNTVWTGDIVQYRLQLWTLDGRKLKEIVRKVDWFRPHDRFRQPPDVRATPHPPGLVAVQPDSAGLLWTIVRVPDRDWKNALGIRPRTGRVGVLNFEKYWDSIVEVINPNTGNVIASMRLNEVLYGFVAPGIAFQIHEDDTGEMSFVMWQFNLDSRRTP